jgi:hypothetical protein
VHFSHATLANKPSHGFTRRASSVALRGLQPDGFLPGSRAAADAA